MVNPKFTKDQYIYADEKETGNILKIDSITLSTVALIGLSYTVNVLLEV